NGPGDWLPCRERFITPEARAKFVPGDCPVRVLGIKEVNWWEVSESDRETAHMVLLVALVAGNIDIQRRVVETTCSAVWTVIRDSLFEKIDPELWEVSGVDPRYLFLSGQKSAAYVFTDI